MFDMTTVDLTPALAVAMGQIQNAFNRLTRLVKEMDQPALDYRGPEVTANSTAMLIRHLAVVDLEYLHQIMGRPQPQELTERYGPGEDENGQIPVISGRPATELLAEYEQVIEMVHEYLRGKDDAEATREVQIPWWPQPATVRYVLWHMAYHSAFHQGQISRLKGSYASR